MLVALAGTTGDSYQLAGVDMQTAECARVLLAAVGEVPRPRAASHPRNSIIKCAI